MCAIQATGGLSATLLNQLIASQMSQRSQPLSSMQTQRDDLQVQISVYNDLNSKFSDLKAALQGLLSSSSGSTILAQKTTSVSDSSYFTATASSTADAGVYNISKMVLAEAHQVASAPQTYSDQALGFVGTFRLGGAAAQAQTLVGDGGGAVTGFGVASVTVGQTQLGGGKYHVEMRKNDAAWQFRVVDDAGNAQSVADAGATDVYTSGWQNLADVGSGLSYNTGRGLTVNFASLTPAGEGPLLQESAPTVEYTAQGTQISVAATDALNDIRTKINQGAYPAGSGVQASVINNQLVLTATKMGTAHTISVADVTGNALSGLGMYNGSWQHVLNEAVNGAVTVNNIEVMGLESNSGLDNVISGVTLNLLKPATDSANLRLTVNDDNDTAKLAVGKFVNTFNALNDYLYNKTTITKNSDGKTYTRAALAEDSVFGNLRSYLVGDLLKTPTGLSAGAPKTLREIGLTFDDNLTLSVSNSSKLATALTNNRAGVQELFDKLLGANAGLLKRINGYTGGDGKTGIISSALTQLNKQSSSLDKQITEEKSDLKTQEQALTDQYSTLLSQYADVQNQSSYLSAIFSQYG